MKYQYQGKFDPKKLPYDSIDRLSTILVPTKSKLLELGAATGFMSQYFTEKLKCEVYAVELDPEAAKLAEAHTKEVYVGDLDHNKIWRVIKKTSPFDVVFASAIIEHLKEPAQVLAHIHEVLKPNGVLIMTTPNIAHWRMRFNLLRGKWQYEDYGVLDRTHLKFFTYYTFQELLTKAGFHVDHVAIDPAGGIKYFNWIAKHFPNFYGHQVVIKAHRS
jgi:2-polyprenyl-3-methyl-5-hydroxy-6-metoxy-1,4-benzoquinol methylase